MVKYGWGGIRVFMCTKKMIKTWVNNMKKGIIFVVTIFILLSCGEREIYGNLTLIDHILEGKTIISIAFDDDGTAWLSTNETTTDVSGPSLIKYKIVDGSFEVFDHSNSILDSQIAIQDIEIDDQGRVWFGMRGLCCYDEGIFTRYDSSNSIFPQNSVRSIAIDSEDRIWANCLGPEEDAGLILYDHGTFQIFNTENSDIPYEKVLDIEVGVGQDMWMLAGGNIIKYDGQTWTEYDEEDFGFQPYVIDDIAVDDDNNVCAVIDYAYSSSSFNDNVPILFIFNEDETITFHAEMSLWPSVFVDSDNDVWFCGYEKVRKYDGDTLKVYDLPHSSFSINESPRGDIWIGCNNGVYIYQKEN